MKELGELEKHHQDFEKRNTRIVVVSVEGRTDAARTQADFPHLLVLADETQALCRAVDLIHQNAKPGGGDAAFPTTILVDRQATVRWIFRPDRYLVRLAPDELLNAVKRHLNE